MGSGDVPSPCERSLRICSKRATPLSITASLLGASDALTLVMVDKRCRRRSAHTPRSLFPASRSSDSNELTRVGAAELSASQVADMPPRVFLLAQRLLTARSS